MKEKCAQLSGALESYLEEIFDLQEQYGAVRATDLAVRMGCKTPSVTSALRRLAKLDLIHYEAYRPVTLTEKGRAAATRLNRHHRILQDFFLNLLNLPADLADAEACRLEHQMAPAVLHRIGDFMVFLREKPHRTLAPEEIRRQFALFLESLTKTR